jgi:hypothetical protein
MKINRTTFGQAFLGQEVLQSAGGFGLDYADGRNPFAFIAVPTVACDRESHRLVVASEFGCVGAFYQ